jgi:hypothetical protein
LSHAHVTRSHVKLVRSSGEWSTVPGYGTVRAGYKVGELEATRDAGVFKQDIIPARLAD